MLLVRIASLIVASAASWARSWKFFECALYEHDAVVEEASATAERGLDMKRHCASYAAAARKFSLKSSVKSMGSRSTSLFQDFLKSRKQKFLNVCWVEVSA